MGLGRPVLGQGRRDRRRHGLRVMLQHRGGDRGQLAVAARLVHHLALRLPEGRRTVPTEHQPQAPGLRCRTARKCRRTWIVRGGHAGLREMPAEMCPPAVATCRSGWIRSTSARSAHDTCRDRIRRWSDRQAKHARSARRSRQRPRGHQGGRPLGANNCDRAGPRAVRFHRPWRSRSRRWSARRSRAKAATRLWHPVRPGLTMPACP